MMNTRTINGGWIVGVVLGIVLAIAGVSVGRADGADAGEVGFSAFRQRLMTYETARAWIQPHLPPGRTGSPPTYVLTARADGTVSVDFVGTRKSDRYLYMDGVVNQVNGSPRTAKLRPDLLPAYSQLWSHSRQGFAGIEVTTTSPEQDGIMNPYAGSLLFWRRLVSVDPALPRLYVGLDSDGAWRRAVLQTGSTAHWLSVRGVVWDLPLDKEFFNLLARPVLPESLGAGVRHE